MDLSTEYLVLDILANTNRLTLQNVTFWGIIQCQFRCFTYNSLRIKFVLFF